jgi:superfamily II DNA or RNA helicase
MSDIVRLCKINHVSIKVETERSVEAELREAFSFFVPNYKFMPQYKHGIWDGKLYLYDFRTKSFPAGLYDKVVEFCKNNNYSIDIHPDSLPLTYKNNELKIESLDIPISAHGKKIDMRQYQIDSINHFIQNKQGILLSPTGSGKSLMIYLLMRYFQDDRFLIVVPTTALVEQMYSDFKDYSSNDPSFNVNDDTIHRIYSGHDKNYGKKRIVITTWQSVYNLPPQWFANFTAVIGDEAHTFKAKCLNKIMNSCINARIRVGTTGTLDGTQINELVLTGLFGPVYRATTTKQLIDDNTLSKTHINILKLNYDNEESKLFNKIVSSYPEEIAYLTQNKKRNSIITKLALSQTKNTLLLFNYVDTHGKPLYELLKASNVNPDRKIFFISGEIDTEYREKVRGLMENENNAILVASMGTFSTGINIRNLHNIIFASPTKSQVRVLQSIGRGLRKHGNNSLLKIYDLIDDISGSRKKKNYAFKHGLERLKIYVKERFEYSTYEIQV